MDKESAINQIKDASTNISKELMRLQPAVGALGQKEVQDELYKAIYQLTKDIETVKKLMRKVQQGEDQPLT